MASEWKEREIFETIRRLESNQPALDAQLNYILLSTISEFRVEFPKEPVITFDAIHTTHVLFHLQLKPSKSPNQKYNACQLSMLYTPNGIIDNHGALTITTVSSQESKRDPVASFGFEVTSKGSGANLASWIQVLQGEYGSQQRCLAGDMTQFRFRRRLGGPRGTERVPGREIYRDGSRDWIVQAFTRFHLAGLLSLRGYSKAAFHEGKPVEFMNFNLCVVNDEIHPALGDFWFPDVISKIFAYHEDPSSVGISQVAIRCGGFEDNTFNRQVMVRVADKYNNMTHTLRYKYYQAPKTPGSSGSNPTGGASPQRRAPPGGPSLPSSTDAPPQAQITIVAGSNVRVRTGNGIPPPAGGPSPPGRPSLPGNPLPPSGTDTISISSARRLVTVDGGLAPPIGPSLPGRASLPGRPLPPGRPSPPSDTNAASKVQISISGGGNRNLRIDTGVQSSAGGRSQPNGTGVPSQAQISTGGNRRLKTGNGGQLGGSQKG